VPDGITYTALLAADLPLLTGEAIDVLRLTVESAPMQGAVYRDAEGRRQMLCGVWRTTALRGAVERLAAERGDLHGASVRELMEYLRVAEVSWRRPGPPPWFDCDTDDDLRTAEEWAR
jgi:molybdopterin-guanine dinucleotide biosynthesis protein A